jgi:hypothetical protein
VKTPVHLIPAAVLILAGCGREPVASEFVGRWTAAPDAPGLLKGRLSASSYGLTLAPDGTAVFENVPWNLYGRPPGPLVSGTGTWNLQKSSGRTVLNGNVTSAGRNLGLEFEILSGSGRPTLYVDLTDPDQMERFKFVPTP